MSRLAGALVLGLLLAGGLAACGKKGALEPPPQGAVETPATETLAA